MSRHNVKYKDLYEEQVTLVTSIQQELKEKEAYIQAREEYIKCLQRLLESQEALIKAKDELLASQCTQEFHFTLPSKDQDWVEQLRKIPQRGKPAILNDGRDAGQAPMQSDVKVTSDGEGMP